MQRMVCGDRMCMVTESLNRRTSQTDGKQMTTTRQDPDSNQLASEAQVTTDESPFSSLPLR